MNHDGRYFELHENQQSNGTLRLAFPLLSMRNSRMCARLTSLQPAKHILDPRRRMVRHHAGPKASFVKRRRFFPVVVLTMIMFLNFSLTSLPVLATRGSYTGVNGKIVFHVGPNCQSCKPPFIEYEVYVMNPDGTDLKQLTPPSWTYVDLLPTAWYPVWSPNGSKIGFSYEPLANNIWIMNADGSSWFDVTCYPGGQAVVADTGDAAWSPDGSKIAFTLHGDQAMEVVNAAACGTVTELIPGGEGSVGSPHWSPDGTKILFHRYRDDHANGTIYMMNADGSDQRLIRSSGQDPCWSPDGSQIVFSSGEGIWMMRATDGAVLAKLTDNAADIEPNWSPDGAKIVFARGDRSGLNGPSSIWVVNSDGSNPTRLTAPDSDFYAHHPDWQRLTPAPQGFGVAPAFAVMGIGAVVAAVVIASVVVAARQAKPEVFTYGGQYYCRRHRVLVAPVQGGYWCPVEGRLLRA